MALSNKQVKDKLRRLARQDAPALPEQSGGYQFDTPPSARRPRRWIPAMAAAAACAAACVAAAFLVYPFLSGKQLPTMESVSVSSGNDEPSQDAASAGSIENIQYIHTGGYCDWLSYPRIVRITSTQDLAAYYEIYAGIYNLERVSALYQQENGIGWLDAVEAYDDAWFELHTLFMLVLEEGSGSISHSVTGLEEWEGQYYLDVERHVPEMCTCDMAEWHILIEGDKNLTPAGVWFAGEEKPVESPPRSVQQEEDTLLQHMAACAQQQLTEEERRTVTNLDNPQIEKLTYGEIKNMPLHYYYGAYNPGYDESPVWRATFTTSLDGVLGSIVYYMSESGHVFATGLRE